MEHLTYFLNLLKHKLSLTEKLFWELSNDDTHSTEQELQLAKELMIQERHIQLIEQTIGYDVSLIRLQNQDKQFEFAFPFQYAMNLIQNPEVESLFLGFKIIDISEEFGKINLDTITEEQVKGFLVMKFDDNSSQKSDAWEDDLGEVVEVDNQELEALEKDVDQQEMKIELEEEQMIKEQQEQENHVDPTWKIDESKAKLQIHKKIICTFAQNPNSKDIIASGSEDDQFKIIKLSSQQTLFERKYDETVGLVDFSFDGKYVAVGILTGRIHVYTMSDMSEKTLEGSQTEPSVLKWHPKGNVLLAGFQDSTLWMWNGANGEVMSVFGGHEAEITCGGFTLDGKLVVSGSADQSFRVWKPNTAEQLIKISASSHKHNYHKDDVVCFTQHHKLPIICTGSSDSTIAFINFEDGKVVGKSDSLGDSIVEVCFIGTNQQIVVAGDMKGSIFIYNWNNMKLMEKLCICKNSITKILFHNHQFYISSLDGKIVSFDVRQMHNNRVLQAQSGIYEMIVEEGLILVGCENGFIYVY